MKLHDIKDGSTLTASEFYNKHKDESDTDELDLFRDSSDEDSIKESDTNNSGKLVYRPIVDPNDVIKEPPKSYEELVNCFRERLHLQSSLNYTSINDQRELVTIIIMSHSTGGHGMYDHLAAKQCVLAKADVLIMAIISIWPEHRKQAPDPFLSDIGNKELQRKVAVSVIETVEKLFYDYVVKAEEWNVKEVFSCAANLSRLKTQMLHEADRSLNVLNIRRKIAEKMRMKPEEGWLLQPELNQVPMITPKADSILSSAQQAQSHQEFVKKQLKEISAMMPSISEEYLRNNYDQVIMHYEEALESQKNKVYLKQETNSAPNSKESVGSECQKGFHENEHHFPNFDNSNGDHDLKLLRSDSMPFLQDKGELPEELKSLQNTAEKTRRLSVNQLLVNSNFTHKINKGKQLSLRDDLALLATVSNLEEKSAVTSDDFSPLLQVHNQRKSPTKKENINKEKVVPVVKDENVKNRSQQIYSDQPPILNVKVPGKNNIVRISDANISNRTNESVLTLHKHPTIYNEFLNEIDDETVKSLDHHLYVGAEIQDVYNEITKTMKKDYLAFDQDDYVEDSVTTCSNLSHLSMSGLLQEKHNVLVANANLRVFDQPPWEEIGSPDEWRNEPKFAGIGREDMLKINSKTDLKSTRRSTYMTESITTASAGQLSKSYSAWLTWYRTNIHLDDYKKFISNKETDYLCQIFHLYDSDDSDDENGEAARNSAQLLLLKQREERREKLLGEKRKYEKGYWNAQCISLGGLGRDPNHTNINKNDNDSEGDLKEPQNENSLYICLQDRLESIWKSLKMQDQQRLDMAIKHSTDQSMERLAQVVEYWGVLSELIVQRENHIMKLETFERSASDPNRFFEKGPNGSSVARFHESKVRDKLNKQITGLDQKILPLLHFVKKNFNDDVTYQGRNYISKMQNDRIEMLYWLQQERRKTTLEFVLANNKPPTSKSFVDLPPVT